MIFIATTCAFVFKCEISTLGFAKVAEGQVLTISVGAANWVVLGCADAGAGLRMNLNGEQQKDAAN